MTQALKEAVDKLQVLPENEQNEAAHFMRLLAHVILKRKQRHCAEAR